MVTLAGAMLPVIPATFAWIEDRTSQTGLAYWLVGSAVTGLTVPFAASLAGVGARALPGTIAGWFAGILTFGVVHEYVYDAHEALIPPWMALAQAGTTTLIAGW